MPPRPSYALGSVGLPLVLGTVVVQRDVTIQHSPGQGWGCIPDPDDSGSDGGSDVSGPSVGNASVISLSSQTLLLARNTITPGVRRGRRGRRVRGQPLRAFLGRFWSFSEGVGRMRAVEGLKDVLAHIQENDQLPGPRDGEVSLEPQNMLYLRCRSAYERGVPMKVAAVREMQGTVGETVMSDIERLVFFVHNDAMAEDASYRRVCTGAGLDVMGRAFVRHVQLVAAALVIPERFDVHLAVALDERRQELTKRPNKIGDWFRRVWVKITRRTLPDVEALGGSLYVAPDASLPVRPRYVQ